MVRLSIIIPVYNEERFLKRCLDSVANAPEDVQIIVINDASTDRSQELLSNYHGFYFGNHKKNLGVSVTRNEGIEEAQGEWIAFLDADDCLKQNGIETMLQVIDEHPAESVIQMNHIRCQADGRLILDPRYYSRPGFHDLSDLPPKWATVWNKLYKKSFLDEFIIYFPNYQQYDEDRCFNIQCLSHTKGFFCVEQSALVKYFDNKQSLCHTINREKMIKAVDTLVELLTEEDDPKMIEIIRDSLVMHLNSRKFKNSFKI